MVSDQRHSTVSYLLIEDLLDAIREIAEPHVFHQILLKAGISILGDRRKARISRDQIVRLYKVAAHMTGDEMMGLWSRPIRKGALKQICVASLSASSLGAGIFRMATFWNLVLDDCQLKLTASNDHAHLALIPQEGAQLNRFGQMLLLKLTHGLASWLAGRELPVAQVGFAFPQPEFAEDYPVLFPANCKFSAPISQISFDRALWANPINRQFSELSEFLNQAPRDWIFTSSHEHALALQVREHLYQTHFEATLQSTADYMNVTTRTLIRRLEAQATSFQTIKDNTRRDQAMSALSEGVSVEAVAQDLGFSSVSTFHRAFKSWTGLTPAGFRKSAV